MSHANNSKSASPLINRRLSVLRLSRNTVCKHHRFCNITDNPCNKFISGYTKMNFPEENIIGVCHLYQTVAATHIDITKSNSPCIINGYKLIALCLNVFDKKSFKRRFRNTVNLYKLSSLFYNNIFDNNIPVKRSKLVNL